LGRSASGNKRSCDFSVTLCGINLKIVREIGKGRTGPDSIRMRKYLTHYFLRKAVKKEMLVLVCNVYGEFGFVDFYSFESLL
jgi:hypothetical protein